MKKKMSELEVVQKHNEMIRAGKTKKEIADELGYTIPSYQAILCKVRGALRARLIESGKTEEEARKITRTKVLVFSKTPGVSGADLAAIALLEE